MVNKCAIITLNAVVLSFVGRVALAADQPLSPWVLQGGVYAINPDVERQPIGGIPGSSADLSSDSAPGLSLTYVFTQHLSAEFLMVLPFEHELNAGGSLAPVGTLADLKTTFPTLIGQYSFGDAANTLRPFVGLGVSYVRVFDIEPSPSLDLLLGEGADLNVDPTVTWIAQCGLAFRLSSHWSAIAELAFLTAQTDAKLSGPAGSITDSISFDVWAFAATLAYRF